MDSAQKNPQDSGKPFINVRGSKVALGPYLLEHHGRFLEFLQDPEVAIYGGGTFRTIPPLTDLEDYKKRLNDGSPFTIFELENLTMIGQCGLRDINHREGCATFGISIGLKEYWGKGFGTEATKLVLDFGFRFLNLHNIWLYTSGFNLRAQNAYLRAGFKEVGRRRGSLLLGGKRYDDIYMDCVADEFEPPVPGWPDPSRD